MDDANLAIYFRVVRHFNSGTAFTSSLSLSPSSSQLSPARSNQPSICLKAAGNEDKKVRVIALSKKRRVAYTMYPDDFQDDSPQVSAQTKARQTKTTLKHGLSTVEEEESDTLDSL